MLPPMKVLSDAKDDNSNLFLEGPSISQQPKDWTRGSMGFVISPTSHFSKTSKLQIPAYGISIEVEMDLDKDMGSGMASVACWMTDSERRRQTVLSKLQRWVEACYTSQSCENKISLMAVVAVCRCDPDTQPSHG